MGGLWSDVWKQPSQFKQKQDYRNSDYSVIRNALYAPSWILCIIPMQQFVAMIQKAE
jgi:hypothetical protein